MFSNNNFKKDRVPDRSARLTKLSGAIGKYAPGLNIPAELLDWALNAETSFQTAIAALANRHNELNYAKSLFEESAQKLLKCYQTCKTLLYSQFRDDGKVTLLGIAGATPKKHTELVSCAEILLRAVADLQADGMADILPEQFRLPLEESLAESAENFYRIGAFQEKLSNEQRLFREHFERDSINLRILYTLFFSFHGKNSPDLPVLGFATDNKKRGRKKKRKEEATFG